MFKRLLVLLILVLVGVRFVHPTTPQVKSVSAVRPSITSEAVENEVSAVRVQNGLQSLPDNSLLSESARLRAEHLCNTKTWSHDGWEATLTYPYGKAGENLEYSNLYQTPRTIVQAWVNSPTHYANMTDPVFTEQGVGINYCHNYQGIAEAVIVVNHFRSTE